MELNYLELVSWFTLVSFLAMYFLPDYKFYALILLAFGFGFWLSWSELHTVEVVVLTLIPLFLGVVLLFLSSIFFQIWDATTSFNTFWASTGIGIMVLFGLVAVVGIPFSYLATWLRHFLFPILEEQ